VLVLWYFLVEIEKCAVLKLPDICSEKFGWKIAKIFAGFWKWAQYCHWAILPCSAFSFRRVDRWNRKSQIFPKHGRILKFKHQQCYKLIKTFLETEDEGGLGFELWPQFGNFARFFCAFALKRLTKPAKRKRWLGTGQFKRHIGNRRWKNDNGSNKLTELVSSCSI